MRLQARVALVTGGSRGIGLATAQALVAAGARVAMCARHASALERACRQIGPSDTVFAQVADVSDADAVRDFVRAATHALGPIDILVNNAGILHHGAFAEQTYDSIGRVVAVNLTGLMQVTRAVLPAMVDRGQGVVINVASGCGLYGIGGLAVYSATKFGVVGFTQALAQEVDGTGVRVYAVCPGRVATDMRSTRARVSASRRNGLRSASCSSPGRTRRHGPATAWKSTSDTLDCGAMNQPREARHENGALLSARVRRSRPG